MEREVRLEVYLSLVLVGADAMLLGALDAWRDGAEERDVVAGLRNWNEAKILEMKEWLPTMTGAELDAVQQRIRQYERARDALGAAPTS